MAEKTSFSGLRISHPGSYQENHIITCSMQNMYTPSQETIVLLSVSQMIDDMINHHNMSYSHSEHGTHVVFKNAYREKYFLIMMVDLLSCIDGGAFGISKNTSHLNFLYETALKSFFSKSQKLASQVQAFRDWLTETVNVPVWLACLETEADIEVQRSDAIKLCGNSSKHSLTRCAGIIASAVKILNENQIQCSVESSLFILPELYEQLNARLMPAYCQVISEYLITIRWEIHKHLYPTYEASYKSGEDGIQYSYTVPKELDSPLSKEAFWDLMNIIRQSPHVEPFTVSAWCHKNC